jgi:hypothetical protein
VKSSIEIVAGMAVERILERRVGLGLAEGWLRAGFL